MNIEGAKIIAKYAHHGMTYGDMDYYNGHLIRVANEVEKLGGGDRAIMAALLHDIVEDTDITSEDLFDLGVPLIVVEIIALLTRAEDETYSMYISRVKEEEGIIGTVGRIVKIADLTVNLKADGKESLKARYAAALATLAGSKPEIGRSGGEQK